MKLNHVAQSVIKFVLLASYGIVAFPLGYAFGASALLVYFYGFLVIAFAFKSLYLVSPLTIIHLFYFVFYLAAPFFAEQHSDSDFSNLIYYIAYAMIFLTHAIASFGAGLGAGRDLKLLELECYNCQNDRVNYQAGKWVLVLYVLSTSCLVMIILSSGGFAKWIHDPGDAFLNRGGSGIYVIFSHFFTFLLASLVGLYSRSKGVLHIIIFLTWLALTSPIHGSKALISTYLALLFLPILYRTRLLGFSSVFFSVALLFVFILGLYFRNHTWITWEELAPYALNYFTSLRNLVILIEDFSPDFFTTFFIPFNKFLTPFGLSDPSLYYDMNHMLTDKYFPHAWEIRATEQWPVEADLYLNFYFFGGLPLIFAYTYVIGRIYHESKTNSSLGMCVVAFLLIFSIPSHLRGSLYNHVDFYLYPMFFIIYFTLRKFKLNHSISRSTR